MRSSITQFHAEGATGLLVDELSALDLSDDSALWSNTRNAVFEVRLSEYPHLLLLKKQRLNPEYPRLRKFSYYLRNFFRNYGKRSFRGANLLLNARIESHTPVAYWKIRKGLFKYESCFLYEKIDAHCNARQYLEQTLDLNSSHLKIEVIKALGVIARKMHDQGILHGDLVANNYLVRNKPSPHSKADEIQLAIIDTDHVKENLLPLGLGGRILAMRCFRRWHFNADEEHLFLTSYFNGEYSGVYLKWIRFWRWVDRRPLRHIRALVPGYKPYQKSKNL